MGSPLPLDLSLPNEHDNWPKRPYIALIGPNEKGRRAVASALKSSPKAKVFEFNSYPPKRGYIREIMENTFDVLILELDSDVEFALELIREASECPGAAVLAYSTQADSKLTSKALQTGTPAYSIFHDASELRQQIDRIAAAYSAADEESVTASPSCWSDLANTERHPQQITSRLPAILPENFDGWDDFTMSDASRVNETEAKQILTLVPIERAESSSAPGAPEVSRPGWSNLANTEEHLHEFSAQPPAILPEDFGGWDDSAVLDASRVNEIEARQIVSSVPIEPAERGSDFGTSPVHTNVLDEQALSPLKEAPANKEQELGLQTLNDADETRLHLNLSAPTERLLKISTSKLWSGILYSGENQRTRKFDSAQLREADRALEEIFRRGEEGSRKSNTRRWKVKVVSLTSLAAVLILAITLIAWLRPHQSFMMGQKILRSPASKITRTDASAKAQRPHSPPNAQIRSSDTSAQ